MPKSTSLEVQSCGLVAICHSAVARLYLMPVPEVANEAEIACSFCWTACFMLVTKPTSSGAKFRW